MLEGNIANPTVQTQLDSIKPQLEEGHCDHAHPCCQKGATTQLKNACEQEILRLRDNLPVELRNQNHQMIVVNSALTVVLFRLQEMTTGILKPVSSGVINDIVMDLMPMIVEAMSKKKLWKQLRRMVEEIIRRKYDHYLPPKEKKVKVHLTNLL